MCVGRGGGELTSYSKWGSENTFCQQLFIIFKKEGGGQPPHSPSPSAGPAFTSVSFESKILDFVKFVYLNLKVNYSSRMRGIKKGKIL